MKNPDITEKRKDKRADLSYPVVLELKTPGINGEQFSGFLQNISLNGACVHFEDRYARLVPEEMVNSGLTLSVTLPQDGKITIQGRVRWSRKEVRQRFIMKMGIDFQGMNDEQAEEIKNLIGQRNKDRNMMWNLWEQYEEQQ